MPRALRKSVDAAPGPLAPKHERPAEGLRLPEIPLTNLHLARLAELERLAGPGSFLGWAVEASGIRRVDLAGMPGFYGETLHLALGAALRALGGRP